MNLRIFKQKYSGSATIGILSGISIIIAIGLLCLIWYMLLPKIKENQQKVAVANADIKELNSRIQEVAKAKIVINRIEPSLARFDLSMPETSQYPEIISSLSGISKTVELLSTGTILISNAQDSGYGYDNIGITLSGDTYYPNFMALLNNLFNNLRIMDVSSITVIPSDGENAPAGSVNFSITAAAFAKNNIQKISTEGAAPTTSTQPGAVNTFQQITNK